LKTGFSVAARLKYVLTQHRTAKPMHRQTSPNYTVRIRFRIPSRDRLGIDEKEVTFALRGGQHVVLKSDNKEKAIKDADWLILVSRGWSSDEAANAAAEPLIGALGRALACYSMGADLGRRSSQGQFFKSGLQMLEEMTKRPTLNDTHGAMVYSTELRPMFARTGPATGFKTVGRERWTKAFQFALERGIEFSDRERTAFDIYSVAYAIRDAGDARFVMLFAAIEILLEDSPRPKPVLDHIDKLIALTSETDLDKSEKNSLLGSLKWLRSHSIRASGRRLVRERLGDRKYQDRSAEELFLECYELRNRLMHGREPFPTRDEVSALLGGLEQMVSHLLAGPVLDFERAS
jgi:hypothetical protein